jgi:hypothetical protein
MSEPEFVIDLPDERKVPPRVAAVDLTGWESVIFEVEDEE